MFWPTGLSASLAITIGETIGLSRWSLKHSRNTYLSCYCPSEFVGEQLYSSVYYGSSPHFLLIFPLNAILGTVQPGTLSSRFWPLYLSCIVEPLIETLLIPGR